jgi:hypothetical protein
MPRPFTFSGVRVIGSPADALELSTEGITLDSIAFTGQSMEIRSRGTEGWPAIPIDETGNPVQAATLWVFLKIVGVWYATGAERLRPNQLNGSKPEGSPHNLIGDGWLYDPNRWDVMAKYNPVDGEEVGFMLVSGSTRSDDRMTVKQRSPVIVVNWRTHGSPEPLTVVWRDAWFTGAPNDGQARRRRSPSVPPVVVPPAEPPPAIPPVSVEDPRLARLEADVTQLSRTVKALQDSTSTLLDTMNIQVDRLIAQQTQIDALAARPLPPTRCSASASVFGVKVPVSCRLE